MSINIVAKYEISQEMQWSYKNELSPQYSIMHLQQVVN